MMPPKARSILLIISIFASTTLAAQTFSDKDAKADFATYTTYAWLAPGDSVLNRPRTDKVYGGTIMYLANKELAQRGMKIDTVQPKALFVFQTSTEGEIRYSQSPTLSVGVGVAGPGYYVGGSAPVAGGKITASSYIHGAMVFEMYDTNTGNLLWRGGMKKEFKETADLPKIIEEAVERVFKKYPLKPLKGKK